MNSQSFTQTCMNVFVLNTKEDILKNVYNQAVLGQPLTSIVEEKYSVSLILHNIFQNKHIHTGLSKWWLTVHFWVHCLFKLYFVFSAGPDGAPEC